MRRGNHGHGTARALFSDGAQTIFARLPHGAVMLPVAPAAGRQVGLLGRQNGRRAQHEAEIAQQQNREQSPHSLYCSVRLPSRNLSLDRLLARCYFYSMVLVPQHKLSRRERQIMDVLYRHGRATVAEILEQIPDPPSYSAVRAMLRVLEEKKHIRHEEKDLRYVYVPVIPREKARRSAVAHLLETFFDGSTEQAVAALLNVSARDLTAEDFDRLARLIEQARKDGR